MYGVWGRGRAAVSGLQSAPVQKVEIWGLFCLSDLLSAMIVGVYYADRRESPANTCVCKWYNEMPSSRQVVWRVIG